MNLQDKFQCHYKLIFQWFEGDQVGQAIVSDPITINFNIKKSLFQKACSASITLYNLDAETRAHIYQDRLLFNTYVSEDTISKSREKSVTLLAGYGNSLTLCLFGHIQQCYSERVGTDMVTTIDIIDPDILTQYTSVTFEAGTTFKEAINYLTSQFPNLKQGEVGNFNGEFKTPTTFDGNSLSVLNELTGGHAFIDNRVINVLNDNECLEGEQAYLIQSNTGLLGTPRRYDGVLEIDMLFEPKIKLGQLVEIAAETAAFYDSTGKKSDFNGQYKVVGFEHNCVISGAQGGTRTTRIQVLYINYLTNSNVNLTNNPDGSNPSFVVNNNVQPLDIKITGNISQVYDYIKSHNGNIPDMTVSGSITWKDMLGHGNQPSERLSELTKGKMANCKAIADRLNEFVSKYYRGKKITVTSGWRSTANNARENGVDKSFHLQGRAIDFKISGTQASDVFEKAKQSGMFNGVGKYRSWTHIDVRK